MANTKATVTRTFSLLAETDEKLQKLSDETYRRNKGNVIDWAVDELWKKEHPEDIAVEPISLREEMDRR